jgi:hypothetical protein
LIESSTWPTGRLAGHESAGRALLALHRSDEARNELELAEREMERLPAHLFSELPSSGILDGEILLHDQKQSEADAVLKKAEATFELCQRRTPGVWLALFQLEFIAEVARRSGDWNLAELTARQMIEHDPSYAGGYYGIGLAAEPPHFKLGRSFQ